MLRNKMDVLLNDQYYIDHNMKQFIKKCSPIFTITHKLFSITAYSNRYNKTLISKIKICHKRILQIYSDFPNLKYLNIHVVECPQKRKFIDDPIYVNGGFTWLNRNDVYIYRKKEWCKVLLHEILHHCFYDNTSNFINEAITEFMATHYQCKFTQTPISTELTHSQNVATSVLNIPITYKSNLYAYTVIKYILLTNHKNILYYIHTKQFHLIHSFLKNNTNHILDSLKKRKPTYPPKSHLIMVSCSDK